MDWFSLDSTCSKSACWYTTIDGRDQARYIYPNCGLVKCNNAENGIQIDSPIEIYLLQSKLKMNCRRTTALYRGSPSSSKLGLSYNMIVDMFLIGESQTKAQDGQRTSFLFHSLSHRL